MAGQANSQLPSFGYSATAMANLRAQQDGVIAAAETATVDNPRWEGYAQRKKRVRREGELITYPTLAGCLPELGLEMLTWV